MDYLMSLSKFKNVTAATIIFSIVACLVSESAQAGKVRYSGRTVNAVESVFFLDTLVVGKDGNFPGAIQDLDFRSTLGTGEGFSLKSSLCGVDMDTVCPPGNLKVTELTTDPSGKILGTNIDLSFLEEIFKFNGASSLNFSSGEDILRYDVTFTGITPDNKLIWFIQSDDSSLLKDLSSLSRQFDGTKKIGGLYVSNNNFSNAFVFSNPQPVPEPSTTGGLLVSVALGAVSLLKRNKQLKKPV